MARLQDNQHVRIFDNADFGYRRITVERPLRLNFAVDQERLARLEQAPPFERLATSNKRKDTKAAQAEIAAGRQLQKAISPPSPSSPLMGWLRTARTSRHG